LDVTRTRVSLRHQPISPVPDRPNVSIFPPLLFLAWLLIGLAVDRRRRVPAGAEVLGGMFVGTGTGITVWAIRTMHHHRTNVLPYKPASTVVQNGPFRWSRNPMYLSFALIQVGLGLLWRRSGPLLTVPAALLCCWWGIIKREEAYMERRFGEPYRRYAQKVRRWL